MADIRATTPGAKGSAYPLQPNATYLGEIKIVYVDNTVGVHVKKLRSTFERCKVVGSPLLQPLLKGDKVVCGFLDGLKQELVVYGRYDTTGATNAVSLNSEGTIDLSGNIMISAGNTLAFEGSTNNIYETIVTVVDPTADRTITLPNVSGTVITTGNFTDITSTGTLTSLAITGDVTIDTSTFKVDATNNRVGILTATPDEALDVRGNIALTGSVIFEGATANTFETTLDVTDPTADRTITLPNVTGTIITTGNLSSITSTGTLTDLTVSNAINGTLTKTVTGTNTADLIYGNMADNDQFRIRIGGTSTNAGYVEIATADDGTEPIYVRQYTGVFSSLTRTATLLDGSGNTSFPGTVTSGSSVTATSFNLSATHYLYAVSGEYGSIQVTGNKNTYAGYSINGNAVFMSNGSSFGLYDDTNNQWFMYKDFAGESRFYYAGVERILIKADGVSIRGSNSGTGANGTLNAYAYYGNSNVAGTGDASYHPAGIYSTGTNWLYGTSNFNGNTLTSLGHGQPSANNTYYWGIGTFGVNAWSIVGAYQFYNPSDIRYKQNIAPLPLGMNFLRLLDPIKFTYLYPQFTEESGNTPVSIDAGTRYRAGLSAQNVKEALNTLGSDDYAFWGLVDKGDPENGVQILDYTGLVAPIIQAIKEMDATITLLKQQIETLENK